ncbi:MAG: amino acid adenylation domain-containing protein [Crocinitomicaceae bacterium]|nr:amino acid adenylation domain-containing protein [Crocinitomicaceae bacterium]
MRISYKQKRLDVNAPFEELGIDSILIGSLAKELGEQIGEISTTIFFEYGTIQELSDYLEEHYGNKLEKNEDVSPQPVEMTSTKQKSQTDVQSYVIDIVAETLQHDKAKIDIHAPLEELGIDSIMIGAIAKKMQGKVGEIPTTVFFEYTTIAELAGYLKAEHASSFAEKSQNEKPVIKESIKETRSKNTQHDPIAIIGLSGRYPGANNMDELWDNLKAGKDSVTEIPLERWDNTEFYDELKGKIGKNYCKYGGFVEGVDQFDPLFFSISPREAERMDPQERLFLQTAWEAVEDAGYKSKDLSRRSKRFNNVRAGVYVGVMYEEYQLHGAIMDPSQGKIALGGNPASIANRVSYCMDFNGPSLAVDTMCSSSLTSIHLACNDLKNGDADVAIAGGVNLTVHPNKYLVLSQGTFLSPKGRCESFGDQGQGFVPGEGVGAVVLKRLSEALRDGDRIYATVEGTAINHGGKGNGYTIPNPASQANVVSSALTKAGISGNDIDYIEAHGTGTVLGDPIEIEGLNRAFNAQRNQYCKIGSIKSNIGHCESAAGISGLTKVLLQLKHKQLVPSLHSQKLNPKIDFANTPFVVQQELEDWKVESGKLRVAGISGFGAGGSNAHLVVKEFLQSNVAPDTNETVLVPLSAKNKKQLKVYVTKMLEFLKRNPTINLQEVAYTLQSGRTAMDERFIVEVSSIADLISEFSSFVNDREGRYKTENSKKSVPLTTEEQEKLVADHRRFIDAYWLRGAEFEAEKLVNNGTPNRISLPTYPFEKNRYWFDSFLKKGKQSVAEKGTSLSKTVSKSIYQTSVSVPKNSTIRIEQESNGIAVVHMEAKEAKNMFTYDFVRELHATFDKLQKDESVKVVVLTGYDNVFAMGGAMEGLLDLSNDKGAYTDIPFIYRGLLEFDLPVITAMQGHALGGGLIFGLYGDVVILSEGSTYCANFMNYGFTPGMGATYVMGEKLGKAISNEMLFTGRMYSGKEIASGGGAVRVAENPLKEALRVAREMASKPRLALTLLKAKLAEDILVEQEGHIAREVSMQKKTFGTAEVKARIKAQFANSEKKIEKKTTVEGQGKIKLIPPAEVVSKRTEKNELIDKKVRLRSPKNTIDGHNINTTASVNVNYSDLIKGIIADTLHLSENEIAADVPFVELGLDSINGVEILREINEKFSLTLEGPVLYEYGTIDELVRHISELSGKPEKTSREVVENQSGRMVKSSDSSNLSDDILQVELKKIIGDALHMQAEEIDENCPFTELGMDSINGVEILREINTKYNTEFEGSVLYDFPTIGALAKEVRDDSASEVIVQKEEIPRKQESKQPIESAKAALKGVIAQSLHLEVEQIENDVNFTELGMDSINGVEIIREVNAIFNTTLEASDLYEYPTTNLLTSILVNEQGGMNIQETTKPLVEIKENEPFDLSYMQQAYWVGESKDLELGGKQAHLTVQFSFENFDSERLNKVVDQLIERHDVLRVKFLNTGQQQVMDEIPNFKTKEISLKDESDQKVQSAIKECINAKRKQGPDKLSWPLFDFTLLQTNQKDQLIVNLSLLVCDGGSVAIFFKELFELYFETTSELPKLDINFQDYILHLNKQKKSEKYQTDKVYWQNRINDLPLGPELPYQQGGESGIMVHKERKIDRETFAILKEKAKQNNISLAILLCTIYTKTLALHSRNQHFSLTMMTLGRDYPNAQINKVLGNFSRISVLELDYREKRSFVDELKAVAKQIWEDQKHTSYNGIEVIRDLNTNRGIVGKIAIPMTFASAFGLGYDESHVFERVSASLQVPQVAMDHQVCEEADGQLLISFDIDDGFFQSGVTDDIIDSYEQSIIQLTKLDWNEPVDNVVSIQQQYIVENANQTKTDVSDKFLFEPFDESVTLNPEKIAVIDGQNKISYQEIQNLSNQIANKLRSEGVTANEHVGIMMNKGWEQVPTTLGIMKSGGAYLPLDPTMPESRLAYILEKANVKNLIVSKSVLASGTNIPATVKIFIFEECFRNESTLQPTIIQSIEDLAYTIFTSGSTGFPKGVMIDHRGALNTCLDINRRYKLGAETVVLALSALYFDLSVYDVFGVLGCGGTVVYPDYQKLRDPGHWAELVESYGVTVWNSVPELMNMFMEFNALLGKKTFEQLRLVMMSGDWIPVTLPEKIKQAVPNARIISLGGATEASIWSIYHEIEDVDPTMKSIPYGKALANQTMHVFNDQLEPCPMLTTGNIFIGGIGVAKGYLKDDEKTQKHFIKHPKTGEIVYKTGDLGRVLRNGEIEFLGREDFQVKVQGYRIELGDIENAILRSGKVKATLVDVKKDVVGNNYLVAYVVPQLEDIDEKEMTVFLQDELQSYMIPKFTINLKELPKTKNGKIDRKQLPEPRSNEQKTKELRSEVTPELQQGLRTIWKELLAVDQVSQNDDFFELGGNSLLAIRLVAKIEIDLDQTIDLGEVLANSSFNSQLELLNLDDQKIVVESKSIVGIKNTKMDGKPLFLVHPIGGSVFCYNQLAKGIDSDTPVYGFHATGNTNTDVVSMAAKYVREMKAVQPHGPYRIGGWSFGGIIAFEMAQQLEKSGNEVEDLFLIDSYFHSKGYEFEHAADTEIFEKFLNDISYQKGGQVVSRTTMEQMMSDAVANNLFPAEITMPSIHKLLDVFKNNCIAYSSYKAKMAVQCRTHLLMANDSSYIGSERQMKVWDSWLTGTYNYHLIEGDHFSIFEGESLQKMIEIVNVKSNLVNS